MSQKRIQLFLILGVCAIALHFSIRLVLEVNPYIFLKKEAKAHITQWDILEIKNRFALKARYEFEDQGKIWQGSFTLPPPYYLNEFSALSALKEKAKESWTVWYASQNPQNSALEKHFPLGLFFRTLTCYGVLIYFFYLYKRVVYV